MLQLVKKKKKLQLRKKILPLILILSILFPLILIPKIDAQAATYPATTSFTYTYQGYDYQFYFSGEVDSPQDYRFDSSTLDYLINKASEGLNLSISSGLGAKIDWISGIVLNSVFDFYRNFVLATDKVVANWIVWTDIYGFSFEFTGLDSNYPGFETYGSAYGWRFTGWLGEKIDLVLDEYGRLYGSAPIGNLTFSSGQQDLADWSVTQEDNGNILIPSVPVSFNDLPTPYFIGSTLNLPWLDSSNNQHLFQITNFEQCILGLSFDYQDVNRYLFMVQCYYDVQLNPNHSYYFDGSSVSPNATSGQISVYINEVRPYIGKGFRFDISAANLPSYAFRISNAQWNNRDVLTADQRGILNSSIVSGSCASLWLTSLTTSPLPDPIVLPVDDPIPVSDIPSDPIVFVPDPEPDPDPVPGIDYPVPGPVPIPVPPIPPIVSGNDDLWPDLNITFDIEDSLFDLTSNLGNFEWPQFSGLIGNFTNALIWVSTIMTTLYEGTGFSVLFNVLAVFFIAAALFGLYKWWNK